MERSTYIYMIFTKSISLLPIAAFTGSLYLANRIVILKNYP
jgi:hypothetical protein